MHELEKNHIVDLKTPFKKKTNTINNKIAWITGILLKTTLFWIVAIGSVALVTPDPSQNTSQKKYFENQKKNNPELLFNSSNNKSSTSVHNLPIHNILVQNSLINLTLEIVDPLILSHDSFTQSIQKGDFVTFHSLLQKNPSLVSKNTEFNVSPLVLAILYNRVDITREILKINPHFLNEKFQSNRPLLSVPSFLSTYQEQNNYAQYIQTRQLIINSDLDISHNNYEFVRRNLNSYWENYWINYFSQRQQMPILKSILLSSPEISKRYREISALNNVIK